MRLYPPTYRTSLRQENWNNLIDFNSAALWQKRAGILAQNLESQGFHALVQQLELAHREYQRANDRAVFDCEISANSARGLRVGIEHV